MARFLSVFSMLLASSAFGATYTHTSGHGGVRFQCHINISCKATKEEAKQRALYYASKQAYDECVRIGGEYRTEIISNTITCHGWTNGTCAGYVSMRCVIPDDEPTVNFQCDLNVDDSVPMDQYAYAKCGKITHCFDAIFESSMSQEQKEQEKQKLYPYVDRYSCRSFPDFRD